MTDGIIIAIIGAIGLVLAAAVPVLYKRRQVKKPVQRIETQEQIVAPTTTVIRHDDVEPERAVQLTNLTHKQIADAIDAVPPFHQKAVKETFVGKWVEWKTRLCGIHSTEQMTTVSAEIPEGNGILFCETQKSDCGIFVVAEEGTPFIVRGQIKRISRYEAQLDHCTFQNMA